MDDFLVFGLSFLFNIGVAILIVRYIYKPAKHDKDYVLTFLAFNTLVFLITSLLSEVDLSVGFGFSLFAIFSILRFRTDPIPIRELAYLFVMMALPVISAVLIMQEVYTSLVIANIAVAVILVLVEREWGLRNVSRKTITYERIELIKPEYYPALLDDLRSRTGLDIVRCEIGKIDFLHDVAQITITYNEPEDKVVMIRSDKARPDYSTLFSTIGLSTHEESPRRRQNFESR